MIVKRETPNLSAISSWVKFSLINSIILSWRFDTFLVEVSLLLELFFSLLKGIETLIKLEEKVKIDSSYLLSILMIPVMKAQKSYSYGKE